MIFLCLSDIHGDTNALSAVLATAERRAFHKLLVAGDIVFPSPTASADAIARSSPLETWRRLSSAGAMMVQGVTDRALATLDPKDLPTNTEHERRMVERVRTVRAELGDLVLERIKRLPTHVRFPLEDGGELLLVHGSPIDPSEAMTHDMTDEEIDALLGDDPADVVVCGMSHVPFDRTVAGVRIINVGSVGDAPHAGGAPFANATWIESTPAGISVEPIVVPLGSAESMLRLTASR